MVINISIYIIIFIINIINCSQVSFYKGHDLSSSKMLEDNGYTWYNSLNNKDSLEKILGSGGMNSVRLRIWVNDNDVYGLNYNIELAKRFYKQGYEIYLDMFFSDNWADGGKQKIPDKWPKNIDKLKSTLRSYVKNTLISFNNEGINISILSLGNEITNGFLFPLGKITSGNYNNFAQLWKESRKGVTDAVNNGVKKPQIMIHLDNGAKIDIQKQWYKNVINTGYISIDDWDIFGVSFYPFYGTDATIINLERSLKYITSTYNKKVIVSETDWPESCLNVKLSSDILPGIEGQITWVKDIINSLEKLKGNGYGIFYWEPAFMNNSALGSSCSDNLLFSADWKTWPYVKSTARNSVNLFL